MHTVPLTKCTCLLLKRISEDLWIFALTCFKVLCNTLAMLQSAMHVAAAQGRTAKCSG